MTARQWLKEEERLRKEAERRAAGGGASSSGQDKYGEPGTGDGVTEVAVKRVTRRSKVRFLVEWLRYDRDEKRWIEDLPPSELGVGHIEVLRRTARERMLTGLDDIDGDEADAEEGEHEEEEAAAEEEEVRRQNVDEEPPPPAPPPAGDDDMHYNDMLSLPPDMEIATCD